MTITKINLMPFISFPVTLYFVLTGEISGWFLLLFFLWGSRITIDLEELSAR